MKEEKLGYSESMNYELYPTLSSLKKEDIQGRRTVKSIINAAGAELRSAADIIESLRDFDTDRAALYGFLSKLEGLIKELNQLEGSAEEEKEDTEETADDYDPPISDTVKLTTEEAYSHRSFDCVSEYDYNLSLTPGGTVIVGGENGNKFSEASEWRNIKALVGTVDNCCGLTEDGRVLSTERTGWLNGAKHWNTEKLEDIVNISAGVDYMLALDKAGKVSFFGNNSYLQKKAEKEKNVKAVAAGKYHGLCIRTDGSAAAYGLNSEGQCNVEVWEKIVMPAAGMNFSAGLTEEGNVLMAGKLTGDNINLRPALGWRNIVSIAAGSYILAGLRADGTVAAAGNSLRENISGWKNVKKLGSTPNGIFAVTQQGELLKSW